MPIRAIARLIQTLLYSKRFFPYYVYNILGGIEDDGTQTSLDLCGTIFGFRISISVMILMGGSRYRCCVQLRSGRIL